MEDQGKNYRAVADRIKQARKEAGLSQSQLASIVGVTQPTVGQWERRGQIAGKNLAKAARALGVSADWIMTGRASLTGRQNSDLPMNQASGYDRNLIPAFRVLWDGTHGTLRDLEDSYSMIVRPGGVNAPNAYALTVISVINHKGLRPGSTIYVDPDHDPLPGEWALIKADGSVHAVELQAKTAQKIKYVQIFSREPGEAPIESVDEIHAITSIAH